MTNKLLVSLLAGFVAFAWSAFSWMALPFHNKTLNKFSNEDVVEMALKMNAPQKGIYVLPLGDHHDADLSKEQKEAAFKAAQEKMKEGPFAFISIAPQGVSLGMGPSMGLGLLKDVLTAFLLIMILSLTQNLSFWQKTFFVTGAILAGSIVSILPNMIWWSFPSDFIALTFIDMIVAWFLAGMVIAKLRP